MFGVVVYLTESGKVAVRADFRRRWRRTLSRAFSIMLVECNCCYWPTRIVSSGSRAATIVPQLNSISGRIVTKYSLCLTAAAAYLQVLLFAASLALALML